MVDIEQLIAQEDKLFALFIGRSSSGKTAAAASMPKPFLEIDTDRRANGIINAVKQGWLDAKGIKIESFDALQGYLPLEKFLNDQYNLACTRQFQFASIDHGSATSLVRLFNLASLNQQGHGIGHINIAGLATTGFTDYKFESQAFHKILDFYRMFPCNFTMSAHIINKYGKRPGAKEGEPNVVIGERLTLGTENLSENVMAIFNDVYKFSKQMIGGEAKYFVEFTTEVARNSFAIPAGAFDITGKPFWPFFQDLVKRVREGENVIQNNNLVQTGGLII